MTAALIVDCVIIGVVCLGLWSGYRYGAVSSFLSFVGVVAGLVGQGSWRTALMAVNAREFGRQDPQFHHDLGFYAFILPALQLVLTTLVTVVVVGFVVNLAAHYLLGSITTGNPRVGEKASVSVAARRQLAVIAGVLAWSSWQKDAEVKNTAPTT